MSAKSIREKIESQPLGKPFVATSLLPLYPRSQVSRVAADLIKKGILLRVARGTYVVSKRSKYVDKLFPGVHEVITVIAESRGEKILIHGAEASLLLGLTTQVPSRISYYTSGPSRKIPVGSTEVFMRHLNPRILEIDNEMVKIALSALLYIGKQTVTPATIHRVEVKLKAPDFSELRARAQAIPWLFKVFQDL